MSQPTPSSSSNFQPIFNDALKAYQKRTKHNLLEHPLAAQLQACNSTTTILALLHQQVQEFSQSRTNDERLSKWLDPTVNVLYALSGKLGEGVGLVFSPAKVIFAGVGVLLLTVKDVRASQDTLVDIFERIEMFFRRLEIYVEVPPTAEMSDIVIQILVEVLSILGIATKEIKESRTKKYVKKLFGRRDLEDALKRLDKLTHEEARMATAEILKATRTVDGRVAGVDARVANVDDRVADVDNRVRAIDDKVAVAIHDGSEAKELLQQTANNVDQVKQSQLRECVHKWLSPSDPSTNHNISCGTRHEGTATWFFQGSIFKEWKTTGSLLWIHGKPGCGKSVLCSTIIQDIKAMYEAGQASMAYFYFDFRDANKQHLHDLLRSMLIQLSAHSDPYCDILSRIYEAHDKGKTQPNDTVLAKCLKEMFTLGDQHPTYLIMDALDESPDTSGIPSDRERVLQFVKDLVELDLPNLHICVTSRPEIDIRDVVEPLTSLRVSLHSESGQENDIVDYVKSIVYSDSERIMKRWKMEDKDLVIKTLSGRADGMFRWVFCQLEVLRHCLPPSVRRTLNELPESLDETYERVLKEIKKPNRHHAHRLLQCLVVANRPLRVDELAEVLAVDFDNPEGIAKLNPNWRWEDEEQALLSSCSSLITIVKLGDSRVVQFSHFSVKEFLTSPRFASSSGDLSGYHIDLEPAHTILAQACLSILLRSDDTIKNGVQKISPLTEYAAQYWVFHARFKNVSSRLRNAMEVLFDTDKPYFAAWVELHDIDTAAKAGSPFYLFDPKQRSDAAPLYYAARCGFYDLAEQLIAKYPHQVNAHGGRCVVPLVAALAEGHFGIAELLVRNGAGATVNVRGGYERTPLQAIAFYEYVEVARFLLEHNADVHARDREGRTPLNFLPQGGGSRKDPNVPMLFAEVARLLLQHGSDVNSRRDNGQTPLHVAAHYGRLEVARVLLEHGASVTEEDNNGRTAFRVALDRGDHKMMELLSEHGTSGL
ncbi:hypothetical protein BC827DRAFT_1269037 [Russula dissimulans]|nr:hypothetical protein BC827DRAFT_1269037 [Russula dissimulans]